MTDLTERLKTELKELTMMGEDAPESLVAALDDTITALEAPPPDDVKNAIDYCNSYTLDESRHKEIANMLERLSREKAEQGRNACELFDHLKALQYENFELQQRIEELKKEVRIWKRSAKNRQSRVEELRTPLPDEIQQALGRCEEEMTYDLIERLYRENKRLDAALARICKYSDNPTEAEARVIMRHARKARAGE